MPRLVFVSVGKRELVLHYKASKLLLEKGIECIFVTFSKSGFEKYKSLAKVYYYEDMLKKVHVRRNDCQRMKEISSLESEYDYLSMGMLYSSDQIYNACQRLSDDVLVDKTIDSFNFWKLFLRNEKIDYLFTGSGAELIRRTSILVAKHLNICPIVTFLSPFKGEITFLDNELADLKIDLEKSVRISTKERKKIIDYINSIKKSKTDFLRLNEFKFSKKKLMTFFSLIKKIVFCTKELETMQPIQNIVYRLGTFIRKRIEPLYFEKYDKTEKYIFFPLHVIFDSQVSVRAPHFRDQFKTVQLLADSIPYGYKLYVREHPFLRGARPLSFFRKINKLRNVRLISPQIHPHVVISNAQAIATINSTTGFEGLIFGKPVVTFSHSIYRGLGLTYDVSDPFYTPWVISKALRGGAPSLDKMVKYLYLAKRVSYPCAFPSMDCSDKNAKAYCDAICDHVKKLQSYEI